MEELLAPLDMNFWELDTNTTHQAIASLCLFSDPPDFDLMRQRWEFILPSFKRLTQKVITGKKPKWITDEAFDLNNHIFFRHIPHITSLQDLHSEIAKEFSTPLDFKHPLWRFVIFSNTSRDDTNDNCTNLSASLFMIHHCVADGMGGMEVLNAICDTTPNPPSLPLDEHLKHRSRLLRYSTAESLTLIQKVTSCFKVCAELFSSKGKGSLNGKNSNIRKIHTLDLDLENIKFIKSKYETALNDIFLSLITGAIRRYEIRHNTPLHDPRIIMPVNMRSPNDKFNMGNHLTGVGVRLPITLSAPIDRLSAIRKNILQLRQSGAHGAYATLGNLNSHLPNIAHKWVCELQAKCTNFICTTVPGTPSQQYMGGSPIISNYGVAALMREHGIAFAFLTYAKKVCISLVSDPNIVKDPELILQCLEEEKNLLML